MKKNQEKPSDTLVFNWLDVSAPTAEHLKELAKQYNIPEILMKDCLDPRHLPKYEQNDDLFFMILRAYDSKTEHLSDSVQNLTRKVAIFYRPEFLITIHRQEQNFLKELRQDWIQNPGNYTSLKILSKIIFGILSSYQPPLERLNQKYENFESKIFLDNAHTHSIKEGYPIKTRAFLLKRILKLTQNVLNRIEGIYATHQIFFQDLKDLSENLYFQVEELTDNIMGALNLDVNVMSQQMSRASQRLNEIMRILTIFSTFILPINLITGIYGMNFEHMPELKTTYGYPICLITMIALSILIYWWMKKKNFFE
ncbi:MAG: hypothetical protein RLZ35_781 [Pseudomonadota bacterium]|jgi:magnesium transporter